MFPVDSRSQRASLYQPSICTYATKTWHAFSKCQSIRAKSFIQSTYQMVSSKTPQNGFCIQNSSKWIQPNLGHPTKCTINTAYLAITDTLKNELSIFNLSDLSFVSSRAMEAVGSSDGPYDVCLTQDNLVMFKTGAGFKLVVSDIGLKEKFWFKNIKTSILGFNMLEVAGRQYLVIGTQCSFKNKYTFIVYNG